MLILVNVLDVLLFVQVSFEPHFVCIVSRKLAPAVTQGCSPTPNERERYERIVSVLLISSSSSHHHLNTIVGRDGTELLTLIHITHIDKLIQIHIPLSGPQFKLQIINHQHSSALAIVSS